MTPVQPYHKNIQMIETVAHGLGHLRNEIVFVGGATTSLYVTDPAAPASMPSDDVDCIVEVTSKTQFAQLEKELRKMGFKHPIHEENVPLCRWDYCGIRVDIMPTKSTILGFANKWYADAILNKEKYILPNGEKIFIISLPYFIATKLEAFHSRGGNDLRMSHDLEDIVLVLDGNKDVVENLEKMPAKLAVHLKSEFKKLLDQGDMFQEAIEGYLGNANEVKTRSRLVLKTINSFMLARS